jgi:hypothetical protein
MDPAILSAIITGVATVAAAVITAWSVRGVRGGGGQQSYEGGASQRPRSRGDDQRLRELEAEYARERQRGRISILLVFGLLTLVVATFFYVLTAGSSLGGQVMKFGTIFLPPLVGLIGAIVGFYYGAQAERLKHDSDDQE